MTAKDKPRLMDQVRRTLRVKRYSIRAEKTYCYWIRFFIRYSGVRHPLEMGEAEVRAFLEYLAVERKVAAATQNQALNAIVFLYAKVLERPLGDIGPITRAKQPRRLPVVLSHDEVMAVIGEMAPGMRLMASLMYGSELRVTEVCRLGVRDLDFRRGAITVRSGKGDKDRVTLLPENAARGAGGAPRRCAKPAGVMPAAAVSVGVPWGPHAPGRRPEQSSRVHVALAVPRCPGLGGSHDHRSLDGARP